MASPFPSSGRFTGVKVRLAVVAIAMVACGPSQPAASATSPQATTSAQSTATSTQRSSNQLSCRLPIYVDRADGTGPHGEFIELPAGHVAVDPRGDGGRYFDRRFDRWLPVDFHAVSADETHYAEGGATADGKPYLRVVDVASGAARMYGLPDTLYSGIGGIDVFEYSDQAVYLGVYGEGYIAALWKLELASGTLIYTKIEGIQAVDGLTVWRGTRNPADANAWSYVPGSPIDQIDRLDLRDGSHQVWLYKPGHLVGVVGVDNSHLPIVSDIGSDRKSVQLSVWTSPTTERSIFEGTLDDWVGYIAGVFTDSHGVWFGGGKGFYLYTEASGVLKVSDVAGWPAGTCA